MAVRLGLFFSSVSRISRKRNIQPRRLDTFKFSTDPQLEAKLRDVVGLYLSPPLNVVVVSVDEKSHIQALNRTRPNQVLAAGHLAWRTHDYKRHGAITLSCSLLWRSPPGNSLQMRAARITPSFSSWTS